MNKLFKFLILAFGLLLIRYVFSLIVGYAFPTYTISSSATILNDSTQVYQQPPTFKLSELWNKNQSVHFIDIVVNGYIQSDDAVTNNQTKYLLYPLYPLLIRSFISAFPVFQSVDQIYVIGAILSTLFFGLALYFLDSLLNKLWLQDDKKYMVYLLILFFPASFYFTMVSAESLFLLLSILSLNFLFSKKYYLAFTFLALSVAAKAVGIVFLIPYLFYFYMAERHNKKVKLMSKAMSFLTIVFLPVILFFYHLFATTGDFFISLKSYFAQMNFMILPFGYFFDYFQKVGLSFRPDLILNFLVIVAVLILTVYSFVRIFFIFEFRSIEQSMLIMYLTVFVLVLISLGSETSFFRYLGVCLPMYLMPAIATNQYVRSNSFLSVLFILLSVQILLFTAFLAGLRIYL